MKVRTINEDLELRNKKRKKNQKKIKRFVFLVKFILTTGLIIATAVLLALSPLFEIAGIEVKGAVHYTDESLIGISGVVKDINGFKLAGSSLGNMLTLRVGSAEKLITQECPYIKTVKVRFVLPNSIVISVSERTPAAIIDYNGTSLLLDNEGYVLEALNVGDSKKLPLIIGLKFSGYELGKKPEYENIDALKTAFRVFAEIQAFDRNKTDKLFPKVDSVDAGNTDAVVLSLESRVRVNLGDLQDLNYRLSSTKTIFEKNIKKEDKGILDFTSGENPVFTPESGG